MVKPISTKLRHIPIFSGNTILGDGAVVLIVDPNGVARIVGANATTEIVPQSLATAGRPHSGERTTMLVFRTGADGVKALPLSLVTRLEEVDAGLFEASGGRILLNYHGRLMPVTPVGDAMIRSAGLQPLVIVSEGDMTMGLAVDAIVDIVDEVLDVELQALLDQGVLGSAIIRGRATEILDLAHYLQKGDPSWLKGNRSDRAASGPHVMLAEPSDFLRDMLSPVLKASGLRVTQASDIASARQQAHAAGLDAVLIDLDRDIEATIAFVQELRAGADGGTLSILGMTAFATAQIEARATSAGIDAFVAKFDRRALLAALTDCKPGLRQAA